MVPGERVGERVGDVHAGRLTPAWLNGDLGGPARVTGDVCEVVPPSMGPWNVVGRVWGGWRWIVSCKHVKERRERCLCDRQLLVDDELSKVESHWKFAQENRVV